MITGTSREGVSNQNKPQTGDGLLAEFYSTTGFLAGPAEGGTDLGHREVNLILELSIGADH
jgi:hypothetical protein